MCRALKIRGLESKSGPGLAYLVAKARFQVAPPAQFFKSHSQKSSSYLPPFADSNEKHLFMLISCCGVKKFQWVQGYTLMGYFVKDLLKTVYCIFQIKGCSSAGFMMLKTVRSFCYSTD